MVHLSCRSPSDTDQRYTQPNLPPVLDTPLLFRVVAVIRALVTFAIVSVFRDRAQD
jgi:hypothetical protein